MDRAFFERSTAVVAEELIGCVLRHTMDAGQTAGIIVETEAYLDEDDLASHAAWSKRGRQVMQGRPGTVYIYRSYGIHWMFNIVAHEPGARGAVLVRALEPVEGALLMSSRRGVEELSSLCSGPGKLCQAMAFDMTHDGIDLTESRHIDIVSPAVIRSMTIARSPRIGISKARDLPLRFYLPCNRHVSRRRRRDLEPAGVLPSV